MKIGTCTVVLVAATASKLATASLRWRQSPSVLMSSLYFDNVAAEDGEFWARRMDEVSESLMDSSNDRSRTDVNSNDAVSLDGSDAVGVDCDDGIDPFESSWTVELTGNVMDMTRDEHQVLEGLFVKAYTMVAHELYCDPFDRVIESASLDLSLDDPSNDYGRVSDDAGRRRRLRKSKDGSSTLGVITVDGTCRNCPESQGGNSSDGPRRRDLESYTTCFCDVNDSVQPPTGQDVLYQLKTLVEESDGLPNVIGVINLWQD